MDSGYPELVWIADPQYILLCTKQYFWHVNRVTVKKILINTILPFWANLTGKLGNARKHTSSSHITYEVALD